MRGSVRLVRLSEIMTAGVVTATAETSAVDVARPMRDHRVGSVVVVDSAASPVAMITDRDLALRVFAAGVSPDSPASDHASRPLVCGEPEMDLAVAQKMTQDVIEGALPQFYFHERG
jgi:signal-transduction protein with cAMP-binding, CBS, and nucleotidyltransferase domain